MAKIVSSSREVRLYLSAVAEQSCFESYPIHSGQVSHSTLRYQRSGAHSEPRFEGKAVACTAEKYSAAAMTPVVSMLTSECVLFESYGSKARILRSSSHEEIKGMFRHVWETKRYFYWGNRQLPRSSEPLHISLRLSVATVEIVHHRMLHQLTGHLFTHLASKRKVHTSSRDA